LRRFTGARCTQLVTDFLPFVKILFCGCAAARTLAAMRFDFEKFYQAVNAKRQARCASWRQVAREIGVGKSTLARMSQNKRPDADGLAALAFWAQVNPADFVRVEAEAPRFASSDQNVVLVGPAFGAHSGTGA
jgi:hypothetical protein